MSNLSMNYQLLGHSGLRVSDICLGTMTFGNDWGWGAAKEEARNIYDAYRAAGGNFIDTANIYTNGSSEKLVGEFIADHREEMVVATKYTNAISILRGKPSSDPNAGGNHRKNMVQAVEGSLKRLGTDYIDLYWLHIWDQITPAEEVMRALDDLVRAGKILYIGISDAPAWVVAKSNTLAELRGWTRFIGLQIEYSLLERTVERDLVPMAKDQNMTILAWSPLRYGALTGKYLPENKQQSEKDGARMNSEMMKGFGTAGDDNAHAVVREVIAIGKELGVSAAQVSLAWLGSRPFPVIPIVGATKLHQFEENLACLNVDLPSEQLARLDKVSAIPLGFPHDMFLRDSVRAIVYAGLRDRIRA